MMSPITPADIETAAARLRSIAHVTPIVTSHQLNERSKATVFLKCENFQRTGSFKFRGAYHALSVLDPETAGRAVVTVSSGNHGQALALAARLHGRHARVHVPGAISDAKRRAMLSYGATIVEAPTRAAAEEAVLAGAEYEDAIVIHPFNDARVIAGQGTCAHEFLEQVSGLEVLLAPVGGGGLLSGTCVAAHGRDLGIQLFACEPVGALDALYSVREGRVVPMSHPETIADGLRSSVGPLTLEILRRHVTDFFTVDEAEIVAALQFALERLKLVIEPSSAVALAPLLRGEPVLRGKRVGVIITGGNVDLASLRPWLG